MKSRILKRLCSALVGMALSTTLAQTEQWLQYRHSQGGHGYRWLELATNAPADVALPKLGIAPKFGRWTTPMDASGGRWICLDRSLSSPARPRLFFDSNGNGRLDDEPAVESGVRNDSGVEFEPVKVLLKGEDGPITYHLRFRLYDFSPNDQRLMAHSAGWYEGMVKFGDKKRRVQLIDGNVNGVFNDQTITPAERDFLLIDGDRVGQRYLGRLLEFDGQLYQLEAARDGAFLKVQKAEGISLGQLRVPETITELTVIGPNGHFVRRPVKGEASLPVGQYRLDGWKVERKDEKGTTWTMSGYGFGETGNLNILSNQPARLDIGEPVLGMLESSETANQTTFNLRFQGRLNESVQFLVGNDMPRGPRLVLSNLDGSFRATNRFEFG
ncbi:MAG TPA: hypothetical protein VEC99_01295 [Clostridia bacterium]|nr:hypothetical protein [Clostridia bacterium]